METVPACQEDDPILRVAASLNNTRKLSCSDPHASPAARNVRAASISKTVTCEDLQAITVATERLGLVVKATERSENAEKPGRDTNQLNTQNGDSAGNMQQDQQQSSEVQVEMEEETPRMKLDDLPVEIQGLVLDHLFGDIHSVMSSASLEPGNKRITSSMRHPRRKALSNLALVCPTWRELVQERIYRHIKIKGNRSGLAEAADWFTEHLHLCKHIRHIEYWIPVWADRPPKHRPARQLDLADLPPMAEVHNLGASIPPSSAQNVGINSLFAESIVDPRQNGPFPLNTGAVSATLSEIFAHAECFFSEAQILTLEGGHCKQSHMIRHFPTVLFIDPSRRLAQLPNIRTFAMRGAWNIMRAYCHWENIEKALPGVREWHCAYARPRPEAYSTITPILTHLSPNIRHLNISLDGFYSRDSSDDTATALTHPNFPILTHHLCERLGRIAPLLESLSFTGRICECFFRTAASVARSQREPSRLRTIDIAVKSCCRLLPSTRPNSDITLDDTLLDPGDDFHLDQSTSPAPDISTTNPTSTSTTTSPSSSPSPSPPPSLIPTSTILAPTSPSLTGITHMPFIRAFERLILACVRSLLPLPALTALRIRHIDLDSACTLLNPYFVLRPDGRCEGLWNEEILEALWASRPGSVGWGEEVVDSAGGSGNGEGAGGAVWRGEGLGLRTRPRALRAAAYKVLAERN